MVLFAAILSPLIALAEPWGVLKGASSQRMEDRYLLHKFVLSDGISYCTYGSEEIINDEQISLFFEAAFRYWTLGSAQWLEDSGRKEEFSDIIQLLKKPFKLNYLGRCGDNTIGQTDIEIISNSEKCWDKENRSFLSVVNTPFGSPLSICLVTKKDFLDRKITLLIGKRVLSMPRIKKENLDRTFRYMSDLAKGTTQVDTAYNDFFTVPFCTMLHETGHALGLSDEYASANNQSQKYSSPYRGDGIMNSLCFLKADDVTGVIVLLDKATKKERTFRPFENIPGIIKNGRFILPTDSENISEKDNKKLIKDLRISKNKYIHLMKKYKANFSQDIFD